MRLILDRSQRLFDPGDRSFKFLFRQLRAANDVRVKRQCSRNILAQRRRRESDVIQPGTLVPLHSQVVESIRQVAAVEVSGSARDPIGQGRRRSPLPCRVERAATRDQKAKRRRLHVQHRLDHDRQSVGQRVRVNDLFGHRFVREAIKRGAKSGGV